MVAKPEKKSRALFLLHSKPTLHLERKLWRAGHGVVAGVDEVGRGAWAGPIVAGAVALAAELVQTLRRAGWLTQVNDSKRLTPKAREAIFNALSPAVPWAVAVLSSKQVDAIGIAAANRQVVAMAVANLKPKPDYVLVDYVARLEPTLAGVPAEVLVDGDARAFSIALASVVAKVHRDKLMRSYSSKYPGYGFAEHKGYGTALHTEALRRLGVSPIHRQTYRPVARALVY
jgi:ribonuclease HII